MIPNVLTQIPKLYQKDNTAIKIAIKADNHIGLWKNDVLNINRLYRPDEMDSLCLDELGYMLYAGLKNKDSDRVKRQKIQLATSTNKLGSTWKHDTKIKIDRITGFNSQINTTRYLSIAGKIAIDCHYGIYGSQLTADQIAEIVDDLKQDVCPAYMQMFLGYIGANDKNFNSYGIAKDTINNIIYATDYDNNKINYFSSGGNYINSFGSIGSGNGEFNHPMGITIDNNNGIIYIADNGNSRIQKFDLNRNYVSQGNLSNTLSSPTQIVFNSINSKLYICDSPTMYGVDSDLSSNIISGTFSSLPLKGLSIDEINNFIYTTAHNQTDIPIEDIVQFDFSLNVITNAHINSQGSNARNGLFIDDKIYILNNTTIDIYDLSGTYLSSFGTFINCTSFYYNLIINKIYVGDSGDSTIKIFDATSYSYLGNFNDNSSDSTFHEYPGGQIN